MSTTCFNLDWRPLNVPTSTSQSFVKKKAALTLLRLYRKHPEVIPAAEWALRIVSIMDDQDLVRNGHSDLEITRVNYVVLGSGDMCNKSSDGTSAGSSR